MATYGKKKKGLFSSFSVFQDEKTEQPRHEGHSAYTRLGKAKSVLNRPQSKGRIDESSGDELAETALLYNVPSLPNRQPLRLPSLHSLGAIATDDIIRPQTSRSNRTIAEDKPLPPVPKDPFAPFAEQKRHWKGRPALGNKSTNMKILASPGKRSLKPIISSPIQLNSIDVFDSPYASRPTTSQTTKSAFGAPTTTADAADLSNKISNLMQQAAAHEAEANRKAVIYDAESAKVSALERSRNAIMKATRAITGKWSGGSNDGGSRSKLVESTDSRFSDDLVAPSDYESQEELGNRLDRRKAEGENLSNPKIRSLTGSGNIPRKPLPVYESMRSRSHRYKPIDDSGPEHSEQERCLSPQDYCGFDFGLGNNKAESKSATTPLPATAMAEISAKETNSGVAVSQSDLGFSHLKSGLSQHPDKLVFSSRPIATSTPNLNSDTVTLKRQSVLSDTQSERSLSYDRAHRPRASDGSSLSVKRKSATHDLRSQMDPEIKKAKTLSVASAEELSLTASIVRLETTDDRDPLSPKSSKLQTELTRTDTEKVRRGLSIFDAGKVKAAEIKAGDHVKNFKARPNMIKRSSFPYPGNSLFSRSRGLQRLPDYRGGDSMGVDELQADEAMYKIRSVK
ncbi:hypothetical protein MMC21_003071 [Puttea exsequens]|nr:hypothetical protein [Puttea exsequens]